MIKHPLLIKQKNFIEDRIETIVQIPRENGFNRGIHQLDIDCFFADLGYAEALPVPIIRNDEEGLVVYINGYKEIVESYKEFGFMSPDPLPYKIEDGALIVLDCLSFECKKAGYAEALSVDRDEIPF